MRVPGKLEVHRKARRVVGVVGLVGQENCRLGGRNPAKRRPEVRLAHEGIVDARNPDPAAATLQACGRIAQHGDPRILQTLRDDACVIPVIVIPQHRNHRQLFLLPQDFRAELNVARSRGSVPQGERVRNVITCQRQQVRGKG